MPAEFVLIGTGVICLCLTGLSCAFWAGGLLRWSWSRGQRETHTPTVSVIVAARNEEDLVGDCLRSLLRQDYPPDRWEIVFVDDHSTDRTLALAEDLAQSSPVPFRVTRAPEYPVSVGPKKSALMHGIRNSSGELLLFTDADCRVSPRWIRTLVEHFDSSTGAVIGPMLHQPRAGWTSRLDQMERILVNYAAASAVGWGSPASACGGSLAYRREAYDQVGGIAHSEVASGDDDLMVQAIHRARWIVRFAAGEGSVVTEARSRRTVERVHAAIRHQSTVSLYPWYWRAAFAGTILAAAATMICVGLAAVGMMSWLVPAGAVAVRLLVEAPAVIHFLRRVEYRFSPALVLTGEIVVPLYLALRPLASLLPRFSWQGRSHRAATAGAGG